MPKELLKACETKHQTTVSDHRQIVRILCNEIRKHTTLPGTKSLTKKAELVVTKYKDSFIDKLDGTIFSSGHDSLQKQMEECLFNQNRKYKSSSKSLLATLVEEDEDTDVPKKKNIAVKDSYGCVSWQPDTYPDGEDKETQKEKQNWLIQEYRKAFPDQVKVGSFMKETYASPTSFQGSYYLCFRCSSATTKTLVQAGHVTPQILGGFCLNTKGGVGM